MPTPPSAALKVTYLVDGTDLFGGVKVVFRQAELVAARGHDVTVLSRGPAPTWCDPRIPFRQVEVFDSATIPVSDVVVASDWPTLGPALDAARGTTAHLFQGNEAAYTHNIADHPTIKRVYARPAPALVVSPHLGTHLKAQYGRPWRVVAQPLEPFFHPRPLARLLRWGPRRPPRIAVVGPFECDWKGVPTALEAVRLMRGAGLDCGLVRVSQLPLCDHERRVLEADEFHTRLRPEDVARLMAGCDLLIAASWEQEGFGLPVLEAMACGVPVVASDVACFRHFAGPAAALVPADRAEAFAEAALVTLRRAPIWRKMRRAGLEVASRFTEARAGLEAESALRWVASGAWKSELRPASATSG